MSKEYDMSEEAKTRRGQLSKDIKEQWGVNHDLLDLASALDYKGYRLTPAPPDEGIRKTLATNRWEEMYKMTSEKEKQVKKMFQIICKEANEAGAINYEAVAEALYDAGYRLPAPLSPISEPLTETEIKHIRTALEEVYKDDWCSCCESIAEKLGFSGLAADRKSSGQGEAK